ncbi:vacuolar protein-sorting-associated protein 36-like protein [Dinothrombium tinctorium]|uniref:Vacuolar protein-sorting-associated protein 36 n=1 Tax=Dinothrombium tinctorium TaxID=1965070 RepID=A0A3S4QSC7_9ACAR|nr:vacuolar protein-sorting-associated protein 36-like protein [Dinothrombium tinctorium]RWS07142.1 vacuolar protein-sorting-associated protein 36-like protein [Dinothrombium tinctorium]RWS08147.1 vacuolar protein-sorting-associated protein 36-like protein [Dinothrombium tinctorium]RWS08169.1 vacuolar protein-sorting-associated protein 36-like protein [Dinothrombium tinctorium]
MSRSGIGGIEHKMKEKQLQTDRQISEAFQDLTKLMEKAKEMSSLSRSIAQRLKSKEGEPQSGETETFKSYLLSLGMSGEAFEDTITKEKFANESDFYKHLGKQVSHIVKNMAQRFGGQMSLTDVYCAVNRARFQDLISAEDLLNACYTLQKQNLGLKLVKYESGLIVVECDNYNQNEMNEQILEIIQMHYDRCSGDAGLTANQLSLHSGISLSLARQRLLNCESVGFICRDESIQGMAFFPNKFLDPSFS